jgi:DNA-binding response OmpR family regulator
VKKKILVADDDPGIQDIFRLILEREGFEVQMIPNGNQILKNQFYLPDIFILDKQLSGVDGLDICRFLKKQKRTAHLPVIMVSANPSIGILASEAGADDYVEKPFEVKYLLKKIQTHIMDENVPVPDPAG